MSHNNSDVGQWQQNYFYTLVDENDNNGSGGKQSPNNSEKLSPKMVGGEFSLFRYYKRNCTPEYFQWKLLTKATFLSLNFVLSK